MRIYVVLEGTEVVALFTAEARLVGWLSRKPMKDWPTNRRVLQYLEGAGGARAGGAPMPEKFWSRFS